MKQYSSALLMSGLAMLWISAASPASASAETQTKSYVVSWMFPTAYSEDGDCRALEPVTEPGRGLEETLYRKVLAQIGKSPQEIEELLKNPDDMEAKAKLRDYVINRGRVNGKPVNVYQNPESYPDPKINTVIGKYAIGFNLDGKGSEDPNAFEDPYTHEKGIDNQFFRAVGCFGPLRAVPPAHPSQWSYAWLLYRETAPAWLISISGEDLTKDGDVTVTFNKAFDHIELDARAEVRRDMTFRIDPNPRTQVKFRGKMSAGVIDIEPGHFNFIGDLLASYDITNTHLRLKLQPDGSLEGLMGGYQTWAPIYLFYSEQDFVHESLFGLIVPGIYHALKRLADADPDPVTGQNRRISIAYSLTAVPAFAVPAGKPVQVVKGTTAASSAAPVSHSLAKEPDSSGGAASARRLTGDQYQRIIKDVFGSEIEVKGRFEPDVRDGPVGGLAAVGAGKVSVSVTGFEQYNGTARAIAAQVVSEKNRDLLIPCKPVSETTPDADCARTFLSSAGRLLFRRPLTSVELDAYVAMAETGTKNLNSFYSGLQVSLGGMLQSLPFLFREEIAEPDPAHPGRYRLDAYSKASRLSFLLWNAAPDPALLAVAESGAIHTPRGLAEQVDRMLASRRLEDGIRAFFTDMLHLDQLSKVSKDGTIYPKYTADVPKDALEQTLRTITDHIVTQRGDYRDLFTTRKTFLTPLLGSVYGVPVTTNGALNEVDLWQPYEFPEGDPRAGILTQVTFVSLHSHPGRTSPTLRGKALREVLLCEKVPDPPANVNFTVLQDTSNPEFKTTRERLGAHSREPMCAGCHKITDPMGLALEHFDSAGGFRLTENGKQIDTSGAFSGKKFNDAAGLGKAVREYKGVTSCLVDKLYAYAVGRTAEKGEGEWIAHLKRSFGEVGYRIPDLLRQLARSDAFYRVTAPDMKDPGLIAESATPAKVAVERRQ